MYIKIFLLNKKETSLMMNNKPIIKIKYENNFSSNAKPNKNKRVLIVEIVNIGVISNLILNDFAKNIHQPQNEIKNNKKNKYCILKLLTIFVIYPYSLY